MTILLIIIAAELGIIAGLIWLVVKRIDTLIGYTSGTIPLPDYEAK